MLIILMSIGGYFCIKSCAPAVRSSFEEAKKAGALQADRRAQIAIHDVKVTRGLMGDARVNLTISNHGELAAKDFLMRLNAFAPSGTALDNLKATLYDRVEAGTSRRFENLSFGTMDPQATGFGKIQLVECIFDVPKAPPAPEGGE
jgi:hypothetical protein